MECDKCWGQGCGEAPGTEAAQLTHQFLSEFGEGAVTEGFPREIVSKCGSGWVCSLVFWPRSLQEECISHMA